MNNFYIGTIEKILDPDLYTIEVNIPGYQNNLRAFPKRGEVDEPRVGDKVILQELDPTYRSYYLYEKLKENDFIGIRSRGKMIKITESEVTVGVFTEGDYQDDSTPDFDAWVKMDSSGNIEVSGGKASVTLTGDAKIDVAGKADITVQGKSRVELNGGADIKMAGNVNLGGAGKLKVSGAAVPNGKPGPFWGGGSVVPAPGSPCGTDTIILS